MKHSRNYFFGRVGHAALAAAGIFSEHRTMGANKTGWTGGTPLAGVPRPPELADQQPRPACSFCGLGDSDAQPRPMVAGKANVAICGDCAELVVELLT